MLSFLFLHRSIFSLFHLCMSLCPTLYFPFSYLLFFFLIVPLSVALLFFLYLTVLLVTIHTILSCTVAYCLVHMYCAALYSTIQYLIMSNCTVMYCNVLHSNCCTIQAVDGFNAAEYGLCESLLSEAITLYPKVNLTHCYTILRVIHPILFYSVLSYHITSYIILS